MKTAAFGCFNQTPKDSLDTGLCCLPARNGGLGWRTINVPFLPRNVPLTTAPFLVAPYLQAAPPSHQLLPAASPPRARSCLPARGRPSCPPPTFPGSAWT